MFNIILYQPEIPPNTGNIIRLCANTGCHLHLIEPIGFALSDRHLQRAGLDYHDLTHVSTHADLSTSLRGRVFALTTKGETCYTSPRFQPGDCFLFGPETRGLPAIVLDTIPPTQRLYIPHQTKARSLNLSNSVAIMIYEAWRQHQFNNISNQINEC